MTKEEKFKKALKKWVDSYIEGKNRIIEDHYSAGTLISTKSTHIDIYSPICYKHKPDWLEADYRLNIGYEGDNIDDNILFLQNSEGMAYVATFSLEGADNIAKIPIKEIPEEMLDEMLAVKDFEPIITMAVPDPTPKEKINPHKEYKKLVWNRRIEDIGLFLLLIALGVSLIALIVKLC